METKVFNVEGMHCNSCAMNITLNLEEVAGVSDVAVSLDDKTATVTYDPAIAESESLAAIIESLGFQVVA